MSSCECGCGKPVSSGRRFRHAHHLRKKSADHLTNLAAAQRRLDRKGENNPSWLGDNAGIDAMHRWIKKRHPKTGVCEECQKSNTLTHYAFKRHPEPYTRNRNDYRELCTSCHKRFDGLVGYKGWRRQKENAT